MRPLQQKPFAVVEFLEPTVSLEVVEKDFQTIKFFPHQFEICYIRFLENHLKFTPLN
jgi:hypothetical protein